MNLQPTTRNLDRTERDGKKPQQNRNSLLHKLAVAAAAWGLLAGMGLASASAQIVKAPRYQSDVNAPTQQFVMPPLPPAITPGGTVVEDVVARINDQIITRSDIERSAQQLEQELAQSHASPADAAQREKDLLRDMIDQQLLLSRGKELSINVDAEVIRQLDDIRKQNKLGSMEELEAAARSQGVSFEDFKAGIRNQIIRQKVVQEEVGRKIQMTAAQEQAYYEAHKNEFQQEEQIRLSEILVPLAADAPADAIAQAQAKANDIKAKLTAGANFADLAKQYSGGPTAAQGGELGLFKHGALAQVLEDQTFPLKPGDSTQPIRTRQGFVILKVTEHQPAGIAPLKQVEQQVEEGIYMTQMQPALRVYLTKLREEAYIDIKAGFVDSGASPNETKPIMTSYAAPPVSKKAKTSKQRIDSSAARSTPAKQVVASPDTTGGRTITGADAAPLVDPKTGLAVIAAPKRGPTFVVMKNGKRKKIHKEKVRFGQAPRNALPAAPAEAAGGSIAPATGGIGPSVAPGAVLADTAGAPESSSQIAAAAGDDPLAPKAPERTKTRFADREEAVKKAKVEKLTAKKIEKAKAAPVPLTPEEKIAEQTQAAPLGLNGDTSTPKKKPKAKKVKHKKGDPKQDKERMQEQVKPAPVAPTPIAPTANPNLAPVGPATSTPATTPPPPTS
jgi:peptidyl-prolyl cis-trans isomerase SurA